MRVNRELKEEFFKIIRKDSQNMVDRVDDTVEYLIAQAFDYGYKKGYIEGYRYAVRKEDEKRN